MPDIEDVGGVPMWRGKFVPPLPSVDTPAGELARRTYTGAFERATAALKKIETVRGDARFSDDHRAKMTREAALPALQWLARAQADLPEAKRLSAERIAGVRPVPPLEKSDIVGALRDRERRARLLALEPEDRNRVILDALGNGSVDTLRAVLDADPWELSMTPEFHASIRTAALKDHKPQEYATVAQEEEATAAAEFQVKAAAELLTEASGITIDDARLANMQADRQAADAARSAAA